MHLKTLFSSISSYLNMFLCDFFLDHPNLYLYLSISIYLPLTLNLPINQSIYLSMFLSIYLPFCNNREPGIFNIEDKLSITLSRRMYSIFKCCYTPKFISFKCQITRYTGQKHNPTVSLTNYHQYLCSKVFAL